MVIIYFIIKDKQRAIWKLICLKKHIFLGGGGNVLNKKFIFCLGNNNKKSFKNISFR